MNRTIKLTNGELLVKDYGSNIEVFYEGEWVSHSFDGDIDYTTEENVEAFLEELKEIVELNDQDKAKVKEDLWNAFYCHSSEAYEG